MKTSKHPPCLALLELAISVPLNGKHPPAGDKVLGFELPDVDKVEDVVVEPRLNLGRLRLDKHAGIDLELFESCLLSRTVLASGVQRHLVHVG